MSVLKSCSMIAGAELWAETLQLNRSCIWLGKLAAVFISEFVKENVFWLAGLIVAASKGMTCMPIPVQFGSCLRMCCALLLGAASVHSPAVSSRCQV
eukprot:scaffold36208_cov18-Tisochrysis_lutea.AAC.1